MENQIQNELTPNERTVQLCEMHVRDLATNLIGKQLVMSGNPERSIIVTETKAYGMEEEGVEPVGSNPMYKALHERKPGEVSVVDWKFRKTQLFLIKAKGEDPATCVWIKNASIYDVNENVYKQTKRAKDAPEYLGINPEGIYSLSFQDDTDTLYLSTINEEEL